MEDSVSFMQAVSRLALIVILFLLAAAICTLECSTMQ